MTGRVGLSAGATRILLRIDCWFHVDGVLAERTVEQVKHIASYGRIREPVFRGRMISNGSPKPGVTMRIKGKAAGRCKRPTAQNQTLSHELRCQGYSTHFVLRDREP